MSIDLAWFTFILFTMMFGVWYAMYLRGFSWREIWTNTVYASLAGFICLLPGKHERHYVFNEHVQAYPYVAVFLFILGTIGLNRERFARPMSEGSLFLLNISLIYMCAPWRFDHKMIAAISLVPTMTVFWYAFAKMPLGPRARSFLGIWTLLLTLFFAGEQLVPGLPMLITAGSQFKTFDTLDFILCALEVMLTINVLCTAVGAWVPIISLFQNKNESLAHYKDRLQQVELPFLRGRILSQVIPLPVLMFILFVHGFPLLLNWKFHFVSYATAMGYAMVLSPIVTFALTDRVFKAPTPPAPNLEEESVTVRVA